MRGNFIFKFPAQREAKSGLLQPAYEIILPNTVVDEGEESYLKILFQGNNTDIPAGNDFFIGLADQVPDELDTLVSITSEPGATGGYARQAVARSAVGWPTIDQVNGRKRITSTTETFTATGADFDAPFSRAFLCNVASGTAGILFSYSGPLTNAVSLLDGESFQMQYEVFLD